VPAELLPYRLPLARGALLDFLATRAIPGLEEVVDDAYRRVVSVEGRIGTVSLRIPPVGSAVEVEIDESLAPVTAHLLAGFRQVFDLDAEPSVIDAALSDDPRLRPLVAGTPGLRVPGAIDGFEIVVRAIIGQQISVVAARTITGRIATRFGEPLPAPVGGLRVAFPRPEALAAAAFDGLGMPASRGRTLVAVARAICDARLDLTAGVDGGTAREALLAIPGIGPWTAAYVAMRALGDPDALPASDLGLRRALGGHGGLASATEVERLASHWRPWRAYAVVHLWMAESATRQGSRNADVL
jgi:AraC family transcriptional regulator, regulatory protein of adaptative response / DNA-3-methyladenine glycosylase II